MTAAPPNILLIVTDQQRSDTLGCADGPVETANLDWLAAQGTLFTHAYTPVPTCIPARAALLTGSDPWTTGILGGRGQPRCANLRNTIPSVLAAHGYHTQGVGKMNFSPQRSRQGFHHTVLDEARQEIDPGFVSDYAAWFSRNRPGDCSPYDHGIDSNSWMSRPFHLPEHLHPTNWTAAEAVDFLRRRDPTKPFFLMTSFVQPHSPYTPPAWYFDLYAQRSLPEPAVGDWASGHESPPDRASPNAWHGRRRPEQTHRARAGYYATIHHIDHQIGRITGELRRQGLDDNTLVIFTSDRGDMLGDHHLWRKTYGYEGSAHVPLIVRPPRDQRDGIARRSDNVVCLQDIAPTIFDAAGAEIPDTVDGFTLWPQLAGDGSPGPRAYAHGEHGTNYARSEEMQYLADQVWKYSNWSGPL